MNIGLLLLLGNLLFGGIDDDKADSVNPNNIPENSELQIDSNPDKEPVKSNTNPPDSTKKDNLDNKAPIITGSVDYIIKQDSYFAFTPKVEDPDNDKLSFSINNLPDWAVFNPNTGSITGEPSNSDVGITENITITVIDSKGNKASLLPFDIEVVNINDRPIIAGSPSLIVLPNQSYKFKPDVIDKDLEIGRDKLTFSIQNKPTWLSFNARTGQLSGRLPPNHVKYSKDNIFLVDEIFKWGHNKPENGNYPADLLRNIIYSYMETNGEKRLLMYDEPYTGVYGEKFYISGLQSNESKFEIIKGINYVIHEETNHLSSIKLSRLKYKFKKNKYGTLWGFNPSNLGNGKNSYYTQGYPTTKLCLSYGYCTNENQSVDYIHQIFSHYGKDYIYAWINVWTEYSKFDENGNIRPILFKGNNPLSGDFDGKKYSYGYPE